MSEVRDGRTVGLVLGREAGHQLGVLPLESGDETGQVRQVDGLLAEHVLGRRTCFGLRGQGFPQRLRGPMRRTEVLVVEPVGKRAVLGRREVGECAQGGGCLTVVRLGHPEQVGELRQLTGGVFLERCVARADAVGQPDAQGAYGLLKLSDGPGLTLGTGERAAGGRRAQGTEGVGRLGGGLVRRLLKPTPGKGVSLRDGAPRPADGFGRRGKILQGSGAQGPDGLRVLRGQGQVRCPRLLQLDQAPGTSCRVRPRGS